jgi:hypothetical protein
VLEERRRRKQVVGAPGRLRRALPKPANAAAAVRTDALNVRGDLGRVNGAR